MTEGQWLEEVDPLTLLTFLGWDKVSDRKLRLFACALARQTWNLLTDRCCREAIEVAELFADQHVGRDQLIDAIEAVWAQSPDACAAEDAAYAAYLAGRAQEEVSPPARAARAAAWVANEDAWSAVSTVTHVVASIVPSHVPALFVREIFTSPFQATSVDESWRAANSGAVLRLAQAIYNDRAFDRLPILADALEEAGCTNEDILTHCRGPGPHVLGCWVVDLLLNRT